jgi:tetratricopeptide repeat protein
MNALVSNLLDEGRFAEAEKLQLDVLDIRRRALGPDGPATASDTYNLACIAARAGNRDEAFTNLREAIYHGLSPAGDLAIEKDTDLNSIHGDPRFAAIVAEAKQRGAAAQKPN